MTTPTPDPFDVLLEQADAHFLPIHAALLTDGFTFDEVVRHRGNDLNRVSFKLGHPTPGRRATVTYLSYSKDPANFRYRIEIRG